MFIDSIGSPSSTGSLSSITERSSKKTTGSLSNPLPQSNGFKFLKTSSNGDKSTQGKSERNTPNTHSCPEHPGIAAEKPSQGLKQISTDPILRENTKSPLQIQVPKVFETSGCSSLTSIRKHSASIQKSSKLGPSQPPARKNSYNEAVDTEQWLEEMSDEDELPQPPLLKLNSKKKSSEMPEFRIESSIEFNRSIVKGESIASLQEEVESRRSIDTNVDLEPILKSHASFMVFTEMKRKGSQSPHKLSLCEVPSTPSHRIHRQLK